MNALKEQLAKMREKKQQELSQVKSHTHWVKKSDLELQRENKYLEEQRKREEEKKLKQEQKILQIQQLYRHEK